MNTFLVLGCGALAIAAGNVVHARSRLLQRWLIPPPIVGGLLLTLPTLWLRAAGWELAVDGTIQQIAMVAFFTSIGFNLDREALRRGGFPVALILAMFAFGALVQNGVGAGLALWQGLDPLIGLASGALAFAGGPATSLAFGPTLEEAGARGATSVALACSIVGILVAGLLTGGFSALLIRRDRLHAAKEPFVPAPLEGPAQQAGKAGFLRLLVLYGIAMGLGHLVNTAVQRALQSVSVTMPAYVGAMVVAALMRTGSTRFKALAVPPGGNEAAGSAALSWFIPLALWTLRYWELRELAGPVLLIVAAQLPVTLALAWATYRLIGRSFDSAVEAGGYFGFMYGTMANSLAAMDEIGAKFGYSRQAFLVISVAGGVLSDLANVAAIVLSRAAVSAWLR